MDWTSKEKQKFWNKAYQNYMNETGLSAREVSNFIIHNYFSLLIAFNKSIKNVLGVIVK